MSPRTNKNLIKFSRGFKKPTNEQILNLLKPTSLKTTSKHDQIFIKLVKHFAPLSDPKSDKDWLVQFYEQGQTCSQFLQWSPISAKNYLGTKKFIYYVQLGEFDKTRLKYDDLIEYSKCFFSSDSVKVMSHKINVKLERKQNKRGYGFDFNATYDNVTRKLSVRHDETTNSTQILAQSLFKLLNSIKPNDASCLIAFTEYDLYADFTDLFVAGLCDGDLRVGVFSCFRYHPKLKYCEENWFDAKIAKNKLDKDASSIYNVMLERSCKLLVHETCHLLGLEHCVYMDCCMNGSGHLEEDFRQSMFLCPVDLKKLSLIIDFDPIDRYERMREFFVKHYSKKELEWLDKVISEFKQN